MINNVKNFLTSNNIRNKKILIAISGGPDSVLLLYVLNSLKKEFNLILEAGYVNHGIRSVNENLQDYNLIKDHCFKLDVKLHKKDIESGEVLRLSKSKKSSIEAIARELRYSFFNSIISNDDLIALGHNRDDQVETQIMRFFQGSSYEGLMGIKSIRDNLIRPILNIDKIDILSYLNNNSIQYNIDKTNNELDYLRNKVRNSLIPIIKDVFPSYKSALLNIEKNIDDITRIVQHNKKILIWEPTGHSFVSNYMEFISLPVMFRKEEIFNLFDKTYRGDISSYRLPNRFLKPLEKDFFKNSEIILEGHGFRLTRKAELLIWSHF